MSTLGAGSSVVRSANAAGIVSIAISWIELVVADPVIDSETNAHVVGDRESVSCENCII